MLSSQNLINNAGFASAGCEEIDGWEFVAGKPAEASSQRIAVPDFDSSGLPHSAYAMELTTHGRPGCLRQAIAVRPQPSGRFALRLATRATKGSPHCRLVVTACAPVHGEAVVAQLDFSPLPGWARIRTEFEWPEHIPDGVLRVQIYGPDQAGCAVAVTDVRLVELLERVKKFAVRFDTRGGMALASSRLRAFMLEDYLHLIGWSTCVNGGNSFAIRVCQKVSPWLKLLRARSAGKAVVYDLDDNELIESARQAWSIRWFARAVDGVTVGSEFLKEELAQWNPRTVVLDNPVDILDRHIVHVGDEWRNRLVWFGNPENLWMLERLALPQPVTTITRGGDIEYGVKTIDQSLVASDLALLPVALNKETLAKNANRLIKCVGLGLPFLASDTAEHRAALQRLAMPDMFLVSSDRDWPAKIEDVGRRYPHYKRKVEEARPRAFEVYGIERVARDWLMFWKHLIDNRAKSSASCSLASNDKAST